MGSQVRNSAARNQTEFRTGSVPIHLLGGELSLGHVEDASNAEYGCLAVTAVNIYFIARGDLIEVCEQSGVTAAINVRFNYSWACITRDRGAAVPTQLLELRQGGCPEGVIGIAAEGSDIVRSYRDRRDLDPHGSDRCRQGGGLQR